MNLASYIYNWLKTYKMNSIKASSYDRLESIYNSHIKDTIGHIQMGNITTQDIQLLINEKSSKYSYSTVKKIHELLNPMFNQALVVGDIIRNPMLGVVLPKRNQLVVKTKEIKIYSDDEITRIENIINHSFDGNRKEFRYSPIFIVILNTGLRAGEALALKWSDINFDNKTMHVHDSLSTIINREENPNTKRITIITDTKTINGDRIIPLNTKAINAFKEIQIRNDLLKINTQYVISDKNGNTIKVRTFQQAFERIADRANVVNKGIHALRHTMGSRAIKQGVDIKVVSDILGHSNIMLTYNKYIHIIKEQKVHAVELLEDL